MSQTISVSTTMGEQGFRDFAVFDAFHHRKAWLRPAVFAAIMLAFCRRLPFAAGQAPGCRAAGCCACHCGHRPAGELLYSFFRSVSRQIKQMHLPRAFYRVELADTGIAVWMYGQQDKPEPTSRHAWDNFYCAYRTDNAVYLYVEKEKAYLLNDRMEVVWKFLAGILPKEKAARLQKRVSPKICTRKKNC